MRLAGRHALVTGAGTGIGAVIARALAAEGATLSLIGRRAEELEQVAAGIRSSRAKSRGAGTESEKPPSTSAFRPKLILSAAAGGVEGLGTNETVGCVAADVTRREEVERAFAAARAVHGPISILVNNAGAAESAPFAKVTAEAWRAMLAVNLDGVFHCCQSALPDLAAVQAGRIVTVASTAGLRGYAYTSAYCAAKHGAVGLMRALAAEYAGTGLTANAVCPGFVDTGLTARAVANIRERTGRSEAEARADLARLNPSGRLVTPDAVAEAVLALILSDRNGETVELA